MSMINDFKDSKSVVVSTRIRLARNLKDYPFAGRMSDNQRVAVTEKVVSAFMSANEKINKGFSFIQMDKLSNSDAASLVEEHLISPEFANNRKNRGLLVSKDKDVSIMINEEDHIRIQSLKKGLALEEALSAAEKLDDLLDEKLSYAFDDNLGFLTYCPTNLGTGMRASVMLHLPALVATRTINKIITAVAKLGTTVRGLYGEGSEADGDLFQVSNQITLGISEKESIEKLKYIVAEIMAQELNARALILKNNKIEIEDRIFRAYGILTNARQLTTQEFIRYFSLVRLGISLELLDNISLDKADELFVKAQAANINKVAGKELTPNERDISRATFVRESFAK